MPESIISLLGAARATVLADRNKTLAGAILSTDDTAAVSQALDLAYSERAGQPTATLIDWIELAIADRIDAGESYPVGNEDAYRGAQWLAQGDITKLPNPMPRDFVLYLAVASVAEGKAKSVKAVVVQLINDYQFIVA